MDFLGVASQEIFGGNLFKEVAYARNNLKFREAANKIFKKISTENALEFLASGKDLIGDRLTGSNFWSSEDRVRARFHYAESRQNKP